MRRGQGIPHIQIDRIRMQLSRSSQNLIFLLLLRRDFHDKMPKSRLKWSPISNNQLRPSAPLAGKQTLESWKCIDLSRDDVARKKNRVHAGSKNFLSFLPWPQICSRSSSIDGCWLLLLESVLFSFRDRAGMMTLPVSVFLGLLSKNGSFAGSRSCFSQFEPSFCRSDSLYVMYGDEVSKMENNMRRFSSHYYGRGIQRISAKRMKSIHPRGSNLEFHIKSKAAVFLNNETGLTPRIWLLNGRCEINQSTTVEYR